MFFANAIYLMELRDDINNKIKSYVKTLELSNIEVDDIRIVISSMTYNIQVIITGLEYHSEHIMNEINKLVRDTIYNKAGIDDPEIIYI